MSASGLGWRLIGTLTVITYLFMFTPIAATALLAFNASQFGGFPLRGLTLHWFAMLVHNETVLAALRTSVVLGVLTALISTALGVAAALALVRYDFPGKTWVRTLHMAPLLAPEAALAVGLLLLLNLLRQPRSYALLLLGHVVLSLPYVVLVSQARLASVREIYEQAARTLGANSWHTFREVTLPLLMPAIIAGAMLSFTISFDNITATLFWRPAGVETLPTQIYSMLHTSVSPEVNVLGLLMIVLTVAVPVCAAALSRYWARAGAAAAAWTTP